MADETVVTKFETEGQDTVVKAFEEVGAAGVKSFDDIAEGQKKLDAATDQVVANVGKMATAFKDGLGKGATDIFRPLQQSLDGLTRGGFTKVGESIKGLTGNFTNLASAVSTFKGNFAGIAERFVAAGAGAEGGVAGTVALGEAISALGPVAAAAGAALASVLVVFAAVGAAGFALAKSQAAVVVAMKHQADAAGTTVAKFQELRFAFDQTGSSANALPQALAHISQATEQARASGETSIGVFKQFGIALVDASGNARDAGVVLKEFATKIATIKNPAEQASKVIAEFGPRIGKDLVSGLKAGTVGLDAFAADFKRLGGEVTEEQVKIADAFQAQAGRSGAAWEGTKNRLAAVFQGLFTPLLGSLAEAGGSFNQFLDSIGVGSGNITEFGAAADTALQNVANAFKTLEATGKQSISVLDFQKPKEEIDSAKTAVDNLAGAVEKVDASKAAAPIEALGTTAKSTFGQIDEAAKATSNAITDAFASVTGINLTPFFTVWQDTFDQVVGSAKTKGAEIGPAVAASATASIQSSVDLVTPLQAKAADAVTAVNTQFAQADLSGISTAAQTAAQGIQDAFAAIDFSTVFQTVVDAANASFSQLPSIVQSATSSIISTMTEVASAISGIFTGPVAQGVQAFGQLGSAGTSAANTIKTSMSGIVTLLNGVASAANAAASAFENMARAAAAAASAARDATAAAAGRARGGAVFSRGGSVWGAGTGTSDSIPAWLSHGEWVIKAAAVKKYGHGLFAMLNSMRMPASAVGRMLADLRGFAGGGPVDLSHMFSSLRGGSLPSFATGGNVSDGARQTINLSIGGQSFDGMIAPKEVADKLVRFALNEQVKSGGRKPSWYYGQRG